MPASIKDDVIEMIRRMPEGATVEDIMSELYFRQQVDEGLAQLDADGGLSHEEVLRRLQVWIG